MAERIHVGTSGWHYQHWCGPFYPEKLSSDDMLGYYAERFSTVEINNSFYQLPSRETFRAWRRLTPSGFSFAVKGSRYITHMKKLKEPKQSLRKFLLHAGELKEKLGPILFQLPPRWHCNPERLREFLDALPKGQRYAFEFRDTTWFQDEIYALLRVHNVAFCVYDLAGTESPRLLTADFGYVRLHGPSESKYSGCYTGRQLRGWVKQGEEWLKGGAKHVFVYFDNDQAGYAARNAGEMRAMVEGG